MLGFQEMVVQLLETLDARLPQSAVGVVSVSTIRFRQDLRQAGWGFVDPETVPCDRSAIELTAQRVIDHAVHKSGGIGGLASLLGAASVPPEAAAQVITVLRLAQRLAVVYGFDPDEDRGQMAVWRALAAGLQVEMPEQGVLRLRASELPGLMVAPGSASGAMARAVLGGVGAMVAGRASRYFPLLGTGISVSELRRQMADVGQRMQSVLRRLSEFEDLPFEIEDADEVR